MEKIKELIQLYTGVDIGDTFDAVLTYIYDAEKQHILNDCNLTEMPDGLQFVLNERVAGRFMESHKRLLLSDEDLQVATSIKEGDTQVNFGNVTPESRFDAIVQRLIGTDRERDIACYRKFKW